MGPAVKIVADAPLWVLGDFTLRPMHWACLGMGGETILTNDRGKGLLGAFTRKPFLLLSKDHKSPNVNVRTCSTVCPWQPLDSVGQVHGGWLFLCKSIRVFALPSVWVVLLRLMNTATPPWEKVWASLSRVVNSPWSCDISCCQVSEKEGGFWWRN